MYVLNKEAHYALRALAMLVGMSLVLWTIGAFPFSSKEADAANVISFSDTLSDSDIGVSSNHTIQFTLPNGAAALSTMVLTFPSAFVQPAGFDFQDIDVLDDASDITLASTQSGASWGVATTTTTITFTVGTTPVASSSVMTIRIGTNATFGATGNTQIINPNTATSTEIQIGGGSIQDSGRTRVVIIDDVDVTAQVNTSFTFTVYGIGVGGEVNGTTTTATSTPTTIPFGILTNGVMRTLAQDLTVSTNARSGFVVTVHESGPLLSSTGADIDEFSNDTDVSTPGPWVIPTGSIANENTWGHWGLTSEDDYNSDQFGTNLWIAASTTPRVVFHHSSSSNGIDPNIGSTTVGYQAQITALQEAGDDYNTTLTYIATPTF